MHRCRSSPRLRISYRPAFASRWLVLLPAGHVPSLMCAFPWSDLHSPSQLAPVQTLVFSGWTHSPSLVLISVWLETPTFSAISSITTTAPGMSWRLLSWSPALPCPCLLPVYPVFAQKPTSWSCPSCQIFSATPRLSMTQVCFSTLLVYLTLTTWGFALIDVIVLLLIVLFSYSLTHDWCLRGFSCHPLSLLGFEPRPPSDDRAAAVQSHSTLVF